MRIPAHTWVVILCLIFWVIIFSLLCPKSHAYTLDQWADSIRITEGNPNYGVISPRFHNKRQVCKNTVLHAWRAYRGNRSDLKGFITFLANRYCPYSVDPVGNRNWIKNMEVLL